VEKLLATLWANKGTKSYRTMLLLAVLYVAVKINDIERRLAALEQRPAPTLDYGYQAR